jgi:hypothetical protein
MAIETAQTEVSNSTFNQSELDVLIDLERSRDLSLAASACEIVFDPDLSVSDQIKHDVCDGHVKTLQKMWLPAEYTLMQAEAYGKASELFSLARNTADVLIRKSLEDKAQITIADYDMSLLLDEEAQGVRLEAEMALYDTIDTRFKSEFATAIGLTVFNESEHAVVEVQPVVQRKVRVLRVLADRAISKLTSFANPPNLPESA